MKKCIIFLALVSALCTSAVAQQCWQYSLNAPGNLFGNTDGLGSHCSLLPGQDAIVRVSIPAAGRWTFSTCCGGCESFNTHLFIGTQCCGADICENAAGTSEACGGTQAECRCVSLEAGTYYVTIEGDFENVGDFYLSVQQCSGNCWDAELTAPFDISRNTCNAGNDCNLAPGEDAVFRVTIPTAGYWTFSACGSGAHDNFAPKLYVGRQCCSADICQDTDGDVCNNGSASCPCIWLPAGDVYVTVDAAAGFCGEYRLSVTPGQGCPPPPADTTWVSIGDHFCLSFGEPHVRTIAWCCNLPGAPIFTWRPGCFYDIEGCLEECPPYTGPIWFGPIHHLGYWNNCHWWAVDFISGGNGCVCVWFETQLSVELTSFTALPRENSIELNWSTASETDNDHFNVYRENGNNWDLIGQVRGAGTTSTAQSYTFVDYQVSAGTVYRYRLAAVELSGALDWKDQIVSASPGEHYALPTQYTLYQNYPNPFNPSTSIRFDLAEAGWVNLTVVNLMGQEVASVVSGHMGAGAHTVSFDAANLASGVYIYRLGVNGFVAEKKMLLMK